MKVEVLHANRRFRNPHWTSVYRMVWMKPTEMAMINTHNNYYDTVYTHLSRFKPRFL